MLVFNYGRHLLVSSSHTTNKGTSLLANLQGIWNNSTSAPWGGKYMIDINIQMNYWPAGPTNLIETQEPLYKPHSCPFTVPHLSCLGIFQDL
ncbi:glycoside hydrolase family 95 protein [Diaporthe eres]|nr:glycoside hydrolase family 95 protein [Diaporthe eres]